MNKQLAFAAFLAACTLAAHAQKPWGIAIEEPAAQAVKKRPAASDRKQQAQPPRSRQRTGETRSPAREPVIGGQSDDNG